MDKYENRVKSEEIGNLIKQGAYQEAADVADSVDWSSVKNFKTICMVSDLYKMLHRYEDSREILLYAYRKQRIRPVIKSLCELSIALGDIVNAMEYFKEFVSVAPKDPGKYILQYKLYKAQNVSFEEQIEALEKYKELEHNDKWAYELAQLYHRVGMESKCVEACDDLILWCVDGKYVIKAYELKAQHAKLTEQEIYRYELLRTAGGTLNIQYSLKEQQALEEAPKEFSVGSDVSPYNTQNLQAVVAEGVQDVLDSKPRSRNMTEAPQSYEQAVAMDEAALFSNSVPETEADLLVTQMYNPVMPEAPVGQELEMGDTAKTPGFSDTDILGDESNRMASMIMSRNLPEENTVPSQTVQATAAEMPAYVLNTDTDEIKPITNDSFESMYMAANPTKSAINNTGVIESFHVGSSLDNILSQEYDGQISMIMPNEKPVEKQITGQISIDDVMREWEKKKKEQEERLVADVKARIRKQADVLLEKYDDDTKSSLLQQIEDAMITAALKEEHDRIAAGRPKQIKVADIDKQEAEDAAATANILEQILAEENKAATEEEKALVEELRQKSHEEKKKELEAAVDAINEGIPVSPPEKVKPKTLKTSEESSENKDSEAEDIEEPKVKENPKAKKSDEPVSIEDNTEEDDGIEEIEEVEEDNKEEIPTEAPKEEPKEVKKKAEHPVKTSENIRNLTEAEKAKFSAFIHHRNTQKQLANVLDNVTLAAYTGNILISSDENNEVTTFAKLLIQEIQLSDSNFTGKVALISGDSLNKKDVARALEKVKNGAIIISEPEELKKKTVEALLEELNKDGLGMIVIVEGSSDILDRIVEQNEGFKEAFNLRIDLKAFDNRTLAEYAKSYAYDNEYTIDEFGILALHTRISELQTADHEVTFAEVEDIVEDAIYYANKKTPKHFFDVLFGKRYSDEDMIVLREKDFMHY